MTLPRCRRRSVVAWPRASVRRVRLPYASKTSAVRASRGLVKPTSWPRASYSYRDTLPSGVVCSTSRPRVVPLLLPRCAVRVGNVHGLVGGVELGLDAFAIRPRQFQQVAPLVVFVLGAVPAGSTTAVVRPASSYSKMVMPPSGSISLMGSPASLKLHGGDMAERIGDAPFVEFIEVLEAVIVEAAVAPGMHDTPLVVGWICRIRNRRTGRCDRCGAPCGGRRRRRCKGCPVRR